MNDKINLYLGIIVTDDDFDTGDDFDKIEIFFDSNDNGKIDTTEDVKTFQGLEYEDWYLHEDQYWSTDFHQDGKGVATHTTGTQEDYQYEFQIPLDSGIDDDISVSPGDTLGVFISFSELVGDGSGLAYYAVGDDWPLDATSPNELSSYGHLVLVDSKITPSTNSSISSETVPTTNTTSADQKSENAFVFAPIMPIFVSIGLLIIYRRDFTKQNS